MVVPNRFRLIRRVKSWLDDRIWWHRVLRHRVRGPVVTVAPEWHHYGHICDDCDYTWLR